jgi:hypothetical protein
MIGRASRAILLARGSVGSVFVAIEPSHRLPVAFIREPRAKE